MVPPKFVDGFLDVLEVLARKLLVAGKVEVGPVVDSLELLEAHRELVLDVVGILGVVS